MEFDTLKERDKYIKSRGWFHNIDYIVFSVKQAIEAESLVLQGMSVVEM